VLHPLQTLKFPALQTSCRCPLLTYSLAWALLQYLTGVEHPVGAAVIQASVEPLHLHICPHGLFHPSPRRSVTGVAGDFPLPPFPLPSPRFLRGPPQPLFAGSWNTRTIRAPETITTLWLWYLQGLRLPVGTAWCSTTSSQQGPIHKGSRPSSPVRTVAGTLDVLTRRISIPGW